MATLTSGNLVATIDATGLANLTLSGTQVLFGGLQAESSGSRFGITGEVALGAIKFTNLKQLGTMSARLYHVHAKAIVKYVYVLSGEDLTITATITNRASAPITVLGFTGLMGNWLFDTATGLLGVLDSPSSSGISPFHPCSSTPVGASYRIPPGGAYGVCVHPINVGLQRTFVRWYGSGGPPNQQTVEFFWSPSRFRFPPSSGTNANFAGIAPVFSSGIHPGESATVSFGIRVSTDTSWQHLLGGYKTQFNATFGPCTYAAARNDRPLVKSFPGSESAITPTNKYGFSYNPSVPSYVVYRFDQSAQPWCDTYLAAMVAGGFQAPIFWSLNGWDTRFTGGAADGGGLNYTPDVHTLPPEVEAHRAALLSNIQAAGMKMGRECQPGWIRTRYTWDSDAFYSISGMDGGQLIEQLRRFDVALAAGFTVLYADSFPSTFSDHLVLKALRDHWGGTTPLMYTENMSDVSLVYSGVYTEAAGTPPNWIVGALDSGSPSSSGLSLLTIARWVTPHTSVLVNDVTGSNFSTTFLDFIYSRNFTPLVLDLDVIGISGLPARLASYNATYLTANQFPGS